MIPEKKKINLIKGMMLTRSSIQIIGEHGPHFPRFQSAKAINSMENAAKISYPLWVSALSEKIYFEVLFSEH